MRHQKSPHWNGCELLLTRPQHIDDQRFDQLLESADQVLDPLYDLLVRLRCRGVFAASSRNQHNPSSLYGQAVPRKQLVTRAGQHVWPRSRPTIDDVKAIGSSHATSGHRLEQQVLLLLLMLLMLLLSLSLAFQTRLNEIGCACAQLTMRASLRLVHTL